MPNRSRFLFKLLVSSSKVAKTAFSLKSFAELYTNCEENIVFPVPKSPRSRMKSPFWRPPCISGSRPGIPVFSLTSAVTVDKMAATRSPS